MAHTPDTRPVCVLPKLKAAATPCSECPWRASNANRNHPRDHYSDERYTSMWRSITKVGVIGGCHLFGPGYHPTEDELAQGFQKPADIGSIRECAGAVATVQQEFELMLAYPSHAEYIKARPTGLSKTAIMRLRDRRQSGEEPQLRFLPRPDYSDITDPADRIDTESVHWMFSPEQAVNLSMTLTALRSQAEGERGGKRR